MNSLGFELSDSNFPIEALGNFESEELQFQFENISFEGKLGPFKSNGITLMWLFSWLDLGFFWLLL